MILKVKKLDPTAVLPVYASKGAACFDVSTLHSAVITPNEAKTFGTGLSFEIPEGYVMLVYSRSGHGFNKGIRLANTTGVVDSDYRGELMVKLHNDSKGTYKIEQGERIAQCMLVALDQVTFEEVTELSETERGEAGCGSTGTVEVVPVVKPTITKPVAKPKATIVKPQI